MKRQKRRVYAEICDNHSSSIHYFNSLKEAKNFAKRYIAVNQRFYNVQIIRNEEADVTPQENKDVRVTIYIGSGTDEPDNDVEVILIKRLGRK